jgi:LmbE family N-acetylglucosaminyl deacetylase
MAVDAKPLIVPESALAIGAHPDDIEFGCGATLARWSREGCRVEMLVLTDGSKGTWNDDEDLAALVATRERELQDAAAALGATEVYELQYVDGELQSGLREREAVCGVIRQSRPSVVLGHDPWRRYRLHPDHRHAGWLTIDGVVAARDPHFFPGVGGPHHRPERILLFEADEPDHLEPADDDAFAAKVASLLAHRSQWLSTMGIEAGGTHEDAQRAAFERQLRDELHAFGALAEPAMGMAEAFRHLDEV